MIAEELFRELLEYPMDVEVVVHTYSSCYSTPIEVSSAADDKYNKVYIE